jgi:predicted dehydrogenase
MIVCLVGYGYWGKILYQNLKSMGLEVIVHDPPAGIDNSLKFDRVKSFFVATPASTHHSVIRYISNYGQPIFSEKPLVTSLWQYDNLASMCERLNCRIFVDWVFLFHPTVKFIKSLYLSGELGDVYSLAFSRTNKGPVRTETSAKWDLGSHDVSIAQYLLGECSTSSKFFERKIDRQSEAFDTYAGMATYSFSDVLFYGSWSHHAKSRSQQLTTSTGIWRWNEVSNELSHNENPVCVPQFSSPLKASIQAFLEGESANHDFNRGLIKTLSDL